MIDERDEVIDRAARSLSPLPPVRAGAVARVLLAVRASQVRPRPLWMRAAQWLEYTSVSVKAAGLLAAASLAVGFVLRGPAGSVDEIVPREDAGAIPVQPASNTSSVSRAVPVSMRFDLANAKSVAVVGDFNGWDPASAPMERVGQNGLWTTTLLAKPGRHTYAFLVDDTTLMADPLAPRVTSPDFGGDASVMMVRTP